MGFVWWFSDGYTGVMGLFEEDHAGKVPCPSHYGSYKYCQKHNLSMLMLNWPLAWGSIGQVSPLWSYFCLSALFERKSVLSRTFNWGFSERTPLLIFHKKRYTSSQHAFIHPLISSFLHSSIHLFNVHLSGVHCMPDPTIGPIKCRTKQTRSYI